MVIFDNPATVPAPAGQYSHVARAELGDKTILQLSGQAAIDADGNIVGGNDMAAQTEYIMDNITAILAAHGATLADVVNIRAYLTDMSQQSRRPIAGGRRREIGDRLFLSPRTASSHLYRSFPKLGVAGRRELRDVIARASTPTTVTTAALGDLGPSRPDRLPARARLNAASALA